jgi:hypothetical protein
MKRSGWACASDQSGVRPVVGCHRRDLNGTPTPVLQHRRGKRQHHRLSFSTLARPAYLADVGSVVFGSRFEERRSLASRRVQTAPPHMVSIRDVSRRKPRLPYIQAESATTEVTPTRPQPRAGESKTRRYLESRAAGHPSWPCFGASSAGSTTTAGSEPSNIADSHSTSMMRISRSTGRGRGTGRAGVEDDADRVDASGRKLDHPLTNV